MVFLLKSLHDLRHQILPSDQAKDGDFVVLIEDTEGSQNLVQGRSAGGYIVDNQHVLLADGGAKSFVCFGGKLQEIHHIRAETALFHVLSNGEIVLFMDKVKHLVDRLLGFFLLCLGVTTAAVFQHIIKVLLRVSIRVERNMGRQCFHQLHFPQSRLGETIDVAQHILVGPTRQFRHHNKIVIVQVDFLAKVVDSVFDEISQDGVVSQAFRKLHMVDESAAHIAANLFRELIAIIEALAEGLLPDSHRPSDG